MTLSTASLARGSARHPWIVIGLWVVALIGAGVLIRTLLGGALTTQSDFTNNPESKRGEQLLEDRLRGPRKLNEIVIVRSETKTVDDPAFQAYVGGLFQQIAGLGTDVIEVGANYYLTQDPTLVSGDRRTTIMPFVMAGKAEDAEDNIDSVLKIVADANAAGGEFEVIVTGQASIGKDFEKVAEEDIRKGETIGISIALVILVIVFGAIVAALAPIGLAFVAIIAALGGIAIVGQVMDLSFFVTNMITMMGLAVGIDYCLFIISRFREERRHGRDKIEAITVAGATASRAVLFSGMTVVIALLGMLTVPETIFRSMSIGAILVVVAAIAASLTLLPAVLGLIGDRVNALRLPFLRRRMVNGSEDRKGFWYWASTKVMQRPVVSLVVAAGLLLAAAFPAFQMETGSSGVDTLPDDLMTKQGFLILEKEFSSGLVTPVEIVVDGPIASAGVQAGIANLQTALAGDKDFGQIRIAPNPAGDLALLSVPVAGDSFSNKAMDGVRRLRETYLPQAFAGSGAEVLVTGPAAFNLDFVDIAAQSTPFVFAFVLTLSFLLLTVAFRSIVVPIKAIILNLLSVGAAYGLVVLVTQQGVGADLLGFQQVERVEAWLPMFLFAVLFGLSMDYHVFLLSRIREHFQRTNDNTEAVAFGLRSTGSIITGAALIMVAVFGGFAMGDLVMFQQLGFGLGVAVLLDATIVRSILVPASMKLLGTRNWYLPRFLHWIPDVGVEAGPTPVPAAPTASRL